jgi:hypothetical protein
MHDYEKGAETGEVDERFRVQSGICSQEQDGSDNVKSVGRYLREYCIRQCDAETTIFADDSQESALYNT